MGTKSFSVPPIFDPALELESWDGGALLEAADASSKGGASETSAVELIRTSETDAVESRVATEGPEGA